MQRLEATYLFLLGNFDPFSKGECYYLGKNVEKNINMAQRYFRQAAAEGEHRAYDRLADIARDQHLPNDEHYYRGLAYEQQRRWPLAQKNYCLAGDANHPDALFRLGLLYAKDRNMYVEGEWITVIAKSRQIELNYYASAAALFNKAALGKLEDESQTKADAALLLGEMLAAGRLGKFGNDDAQMMREAVPYFLRAAAFKDLNAVALLEKNAKLCSLGQLYSLALIYQNDFQDIDNALRWFVYLANQKHAFSDKTLKLLSLKNSDYAYKIAKLNMSIGNVKAAIEFYLQGCQKGQRESLLEIAQLVDYLTDEDKEKIAELFHQHGHFVSAALLYKKLANRGSQYYLNKMVQLTRENNECAYQIAIKLLEEKKLDQAYPLFIRAAKNHYVPAQDYITILENNALAGDAHAQYYLGHQYYAPELPRSIDCILLAAEQGYSLAVSHLNNNVFNSEQYNYIAQKYHDGDGVKENVELAIKFYQKSIANKNANAAFRLGQLYLGHSKLVDNKNQAINHFIQAISFGSEVAFDKILELAKSGDARCQYYLGCEYAPCEINETSIRWIMLAAEQNYEAACAYLHQQTFTAEIYRYMAKLYACGDGVAINISAAISFYTIAANQPDAQAEFELAELYFNHPEQENHHQLACASYAKAALLAHNPARDKLIALAKAGDGMANYYLGCEYYHFLKRPIEAVNCAIQAAEQGVTLAKNYLEETPFTEQVYLHIADQLLEKNQKMAALGFYQNAMELGLGEATFKIAKIYLNSDVGMAIDYFAKAYLQGYQLARANLEALAQAGNTKAQFMGCQFYQRANRVEAIRWALMAAEQDYQPAIAYFKATQFNVNELIMIAQRYQNGDGVKLNIAQAKRFYQKAVDRHDAHAAFLLAQLYLGENDLRTAFKYLYQAAQGKQVQAKTMLENYAQEGNVEAQFYLGDLLYRFLGQSSEGMERVMQAAEAGHTPARRLLDTVKLPAEVYFKMGVNYFHGQTVEMNKQTALIFLEKATQLKYAPAALLLAEYYFTQQKSAEMINNAFYNLARAAMWDDASAKKNLETMAKEGDANAEYAFGCLYHYNNGNYKEAVYWAVKSAAQGNKRANSFLARNEFSSEVNFYIAQLYFEETTIAQDFYAAKKFCERAINQDNAQAAYYLGSLYQTQTELADYIGNAFACYTKALALGHPDAIVALECLAENAAPNLQLALGDIYQQITPPDEERAVHWYVKASESGSHEAKKYLDQLSSCSLRM